MFRDFKLHRHKTGGYVDRIELKFFNFQLLQVPTGWNRLFVSIISAETGKSIGKSGKAIVHNGTCQWADSFSESTLLPPDDVSKELEDCRFKLVVYMGSSRSGILGETILNLTDYISSGYSGIISLPLKKCDYGSILQLQVQCLTRRAKSRDGRSWIEKTLRRDGSNASLDDSDNKSDGSDNIIGGVASSSSGNHLASTSNPDENANVEPCLSASGSHRSSDSGESSTSRTNFSPRSSINGGVHHLAGRQDSKGSQSSAVFSTGNSDDVSRSSQSSFNSRFSGSSIANQFQDLGAQMSAIGPAPFVLRLPDSAKDLLEAAEETIEELRDEVKMWERHARKLKIDIDLLKKECSEKSKEKASLDVELSTACSERDSFKQELEKLKLSFEESVRKHKKDDHPIIVKIPTVQKDLEDELKFLKESNVNLHLQLDKTQESNIELICVLQELEEIIEKQRTEIENFTQQTAATEIEVLKAKVMELEKDCAELAEENLRFLLKMNESSRIVEKKMGSTVSDEFQEINILKETDELVSIENLRIQIQSHENKSSALERKCEFYENQHNFNALIVKNVPENVAAVSDSRKSVRECTCIYCQEELGEIISEMEKVKAMCLSKEMDIEFLKHSKLKLENMISNNYKEQGMEDISSMKLFERKVMELESRKHELEFHVSELENDNVRLAERIVGLEAQLGYFTNEKVSTGLELESSRLIIANLKEEISKLQFQMETQKVESEEKLQHMHVMWVDAQQEADILKRSNVKLQETLESLIDECGSLQKSAGELRRQKLELRNRSAHLELELNVSQKKSLEFHKKFEILEVKLSSLQNDVMIKEKSLTTMLESILEEHKLHGERVRQSYFALNKIEVEKTAEIEKLKEEIACLSETQDNREVQNLPCEPSLLLMEKNRLESNLEEALSKMKFYEVELCNLQEESGNNVLRLVDSLNASKQSEEMLMSDISSLQRQLEVIRSSEETFRRLSSELELKLEAFVYENKCITEEISSLKFQLQKIPFLEDELVSLKKSLDDEKFEKQKTEEALRSESEALKELKAEKISMAEKIYEMQRELQEVENERRKMIALEEKVLRFECDLTAMEAMRVQEQELKNELNQVRRSNSAYQRNIQFLEQDKNDLTSRVLNLEKQLTLGKVEEDTNSMIQDTESYTPLEARKPQHTESELLSNVQSLEAGLSEALQAKTKYESQLQSSISDNGDSHANNVFPKPTLEDDSSKTGHGNRVSSLEAELKDMRERYLSMSLQFAQVEAQREELVMTLKSMKKEKKWFS